MCPFSNRNRPSRSAARPGPLLLRLAAFFSALAGLCLGPAPAALGQTNAGAVHHFTWNAVASPQRAGTPFPVRLTARDLEGLRVTNFSGSVPVHAAVDPVRPEAFRDGFEDGEFADWTLNPEAGNAVVVSNTAGEGRRSLTLIGGRRTHLDGLTRVVTVVEPEVIRFQVRTARADASGGNVAVGSQFAIIALFEMGPDGMGLYDSSGSGLRSAFQAGRWYTIELQLVWTNRTLNYWVDGVLQRTGVPFLTQAGTSASSVTFYLYNFDNTQSWWDGFEVLSAPRARPILVSPSLAGPFVDGEWTGLLTLSGSGADAVLRAGTNGGPTGSSAPFDLVADNQLLVRQQPQPERGGIAEPLTNTVHVFNPGPLAATEITLTLRLPPGVTLSQAPTAEACTLANDSIVCQPPSLAAGAHYSVSTVVTATNYGRFTNVLTLEHRMDGAGPRLTLTNQSVVAVDPPRLQISDVTITEGSAGRTDGVFEFVLSAPQPFPVTVRFATSNVTATAGTDYLSTEGVLVIPAGATRERLIVPVVADTVREPNEVFALQLRSVQNAILDRTEVYGLITDDDSPLAATLPFFEDWERGLRGYWVASGAGSFRATLSRSNQPYGGAFHLVLDSPQNDGVYSRSEFTLTVDLSGAVNPVLRFQIRGGSFHDGGNPPASPFLGGGQFSGVAVSPDGFRWYTAHHFPTLDSDYTEVIVPLDEVVARHDIPYTSTFRIRFSQLTYYQFPFTGAAIDDISITAEPKPIQAGPMTLATESCLPGNQAIDPGETVTAQFWLTNSGAAPLGPITATLLSDAAVTSLGPPQVYDGLPAGGPGISRPFTFLAHGLCGGLATATLELKSGTNILGRLPFTAPLGLSSTNTYLFTADATQRPVVIPAGGPATPYPSAIEVSGTTGLVDRVVVTLNGLRHSAPDHIDAILRSPSGQTVTLLSDAGGLLPIEGVDLVFDSGVTNRLPDNDRILSGTYAPTNYAGPDVYPAPAPGTAAANTLNVFRGGPANGAWELFVYDDTVGDGGQIESWSIQLSTRVLDCCGPSPAADLALTMFADSGLVAVDNSIRLSATVLNRGPHPASNVVFTNLLPEGATLIAANSSAGPCTLDAGVVRCPLGTLTNNSAAEVTLDLNLAATGLLTLRASAGGDVRDPVPTNNLANVSVAVTPPVLSVQTSAVTESSNSTVFARFNFSLSPQNRTSTVFFATASQTAIAGADFIPTNGSVTFLPGESAKTIDVRVLDDLLDETNETFALTLYNAANLMLGASRIVATILDNDNSPTIAVADAAQREGDAGLVPFGIRVQLSAVSGQTVSVVFSTGGGTATPGADYLPTNSLVTLVPGETSRFVPIQVFGDRQNESDETFTVTIASPANAILGRSQATATILNDDLLASFAVQAGPVVAESCSTGNGAVDPGETATVRFTFRNTSTGTARATNLHATLLAGDGVMHPSGGQSLGSVAPGGSASADFPFTAAAGCGDTIQATFAVRDGTLDLGTVTAPLFIGNLISNFREDFDAVVPPALPSGWAAVHLGAGRVWQTVNTPNHSAPNAVFSQDPPDVSTNDLISWPMEVASADAQVSFWHSYNTERGWDGGTLAISLDQGPFVEITEAGGTFVTGPYNSVVNQSNPGWSGDSGGFVRVVVNLPPDLADRSFRLRWQFTSDSSVGVTTGGWFIDSIVVTDGLDCCPYSPPLITSIRREGTRVTLRWTSAVDRRYRVEYKSALAGDAWTELPGDFTATGTLSEAIDEPPATDQRYYRISLLP